jgi:hypothetical protein
MLRRITFQVPPEWYTALETERDESGRHISDLLRYMVRRSLASRGHRLTSYKAIPGQYDCATRGP